MKNVVIEDCGQQGLVAANSLVIRQSKAVHITFELFSLWVPNEV
jgi:hypothetical protein